MKTGQTFAANKTSGDGMLLCADNMELRSISFRLARIRQNFCPELGVRTLTWYTYNTCLPFGVLFRKFWYSDRNVFIADEGAQFKCIGCILSKFYQIWCFCCTKLVYSTVDGW